VIAFAGVSLCRLLPSIPIFGPVKAEEYRGQLNFTIVEVVEWLRTVAISEDHIAAKFAEIIQGLHAQTLRRQQRKESAQPPTPTPDLSHHQQQQQQQPWFPPPPPNNTPVQAQQGQFAQPFPVTPNYLQSPTAFSPFSAYPPQQPGFGQQTGYDDAYFVGLFPELMGPGFVDGGFAGGLGTGMGGMGGGAGGFEDALGFWGFRGQ